MDPLIREQLESFTVCYSFSRSAFSLMRLLKCKIDSLAHLTLVTKVVGPSYSFGESTVYIPFFYNMTVLIQVTPPFERYRVLSPESLRIHSLHDRRGISG